MLSRVSQFHKEVTKKEKVKDAVLLNAFLAAYLLAKEDIANRKFSSLINLFKIVSPENMKYRTYSATSRDPKLLTQKINLINTNCKCIILGYKPRAIFGLEVYRRP